MLRRNPLALVLLLVCMLCVAGVRVLPRFLEGVGDKAQQLARAEIASGLSSSGDSATDDAVDAWIAGNAQAYDERVAELESQLKDELRFKGADGHEHAYLPDLDSYLWLRLARNYLRTGTVCDSIVDGECRNDFAPAPVGRTMLYDQSLHTAAIVALHPVVSFVFPGFPLSSTSFYVTVLLALLGVVPAFLLGLRFGGAVGAVTAGVLFSFNPAFLIRTVGSDNDIWNVVLPLYAIWAGIEALGAAGLRQRLIYAAAAAVVVGLHASTWAGWLLPHGVLCAGFAATVTFAALRFVVRERRLQVWRDERVKAAALAGAAYFLLAGVAVSLAQPNVGFIKAQTRHLFNVDPRVDVSAQGGSDLDRILWPSHFETVAELRAMDAVNPAGYGANVPLLFLGLAGAALVFLPHRRWSRWHLGAFVGGVVILGYVYISGSPSVRQTPWLLAPALLALAAVVLSSRPNQDTERGALMLLVWFGVSYALASSVNRFVMFLAAPVAIGVAIVAGRLGELIRTTGQGRLSPKATVVTSGAFVAVLLAYPVQRGYVTARDLLPQMNDAWWDTLTHLRDNTSPDSIVNAWWHDGHWITYVAERPVIADGASLRTHVPYWFARALLTGDERHSAGLLRMLDCGSAAGPYPEASRGAYGKLRALGMSLFDAHALIDELAALDRESAAKLLADRGLSLEAIASVLGSTHCDPPPAYVVLSSRLTTAAGWGVGRWDFGRALAARQAVKLPRSDALQLLMQEAGYSKSEARSLYREAPRNASRAEVQQFIAPELGFLTKTWVPCVADEGGAVHNCRLAAKVAGAAQVLEAFEYRADFPSAGRLRIRHQRGAAAPSYTYRIPGTILVARPDRLEETHPANGTDPGIAVLIDLDRSRILIAEAVLLRSTFTKLLFLDGRYLEHFEKVAEHEAYTGERVFTFQVSF